MISTSLAMAGLKQRFSEHVSETASISRYQVVSTVVKPFPTENWRLRFAVEEFRGSHSFGHKEVSSQWFSVLPKTHQLWLLFLLLSSSFLTGDTATCIWWSICATAASNALKEFARQQKSLQFYEGLQSGHLHLCPPLSFLKHAWTFDTKTFSWLSRPRSTMQGITFSQCFCEFYQRMY